MSRDLSVLSSLTLSETKDNGAQSLENSNGNFPAPQDFHNVEADFGLSNYHQPYNRRRASSGRSRSARAAALRRIVSTWMDLLIGGWQLAGINTVYAGEPVTFTYSPGATFVVSGIAQDFRGANNYRPNVTCDPLAAPADRTITNWFNRDCVALPADPSQPFGNAKRNSVRGPNFWQFDLAASKRVRWAGRPRSSCGSRPSTCSTARTSARPTGPQQRAGFGTITATHDPRQLQLGFKLLW